ncbi:MAG: hypothetical protein EBU93_05725, partial [Chlamydiae bacterium]|nr:hypothetical protein [Chlamydiota bacterium]
MNCFLWMVDKTNIPIAPAYIFVSEWRSQIRPDTIVRFQKKYLIWWFIKKKKSFFIINRGNIDERTETQTE